MQLRNDYEIAVWTAAIASIPGRDTHCKMHSADLVVEGFRERTAEIAARAPERDRLAAK